MHPHKALQRVKGFNIPHLMEVPSSLSEQVWACPFHRLGNEVLPGVPSRAALAPAKVRRPPSLRCLVARWLEMVDVHMLCFHIRSQFLKRAEVKTTVRQLSICSKEIERWAQLMASDTQGSIDSHSRSPGPWLQQGLVLAAQGFLICKQVKC